MKQLHGLVMQAGDFAFHPVTGESYTLNATGRRVIGALCDGHPLDAIASGLAADHGIPIEEAWSDLLEFVARLRACGLNA